MTSRILAVDSIRKRLKTHFIGQKILYYPSLPSTMDAARQEAHARTPNGTVVLAEQQTRGKGRLRREWVSPEGNIALSIVLYPDATGLPYLIMIASLAAAQAIESVTGLKTAIKWPNDILIGGKKAAGILIENEVKGATVSYAVTGIGINVALQPGGFREIAATSLEHELGRQVSREDVIISLLAEFERWYEKLPDGAAIYREWRDRLVTLGQQVTARWGDETLEGLAESVDESGALAIRRADGTLARVVAGDVTLQKG